MDLNIVYEEEKSEKKISVLLIMSMIIQLFIGVAPILAEDSNGMNAEPEFVPQLTVTLSPGVATGSTSATVTNSVYGSLIVNVTEREIATPQVGEIAPTAGSNLIVNYESGADITAGVVAGNYLQIYDIDMDEEGRIAAFYQVELTEVDIEDGIIGDIEDENMTVGIDEEEEKAEDMVMHNSIAPMSSGDILGTYELGVNVTGTLYVDGKLVISGEGAMNDYSISNYPLFEVRSQITSVEIESGITNIGASVFYYCENLKSVTIPNSVTSIREYAFHYCSGLTNVAIPSTVTSIGEYAFGYCSGLTSITFAEQSQITSIGDGAFYDCSGLTSVTIPSLVTSIGKYAFYNCSGLTTIVNQYNGDQIIGESAFSTYASGSKTAYAYPANVAFINAVKTAGYTVKSDTVIGIYNLGKNITGIFYDSGKFVISGAGETNDYRQFSAIQNQIKAVEIESGITKIAAYMFNACENIETVTIPDTVTSIEGFAFASCKGLTFIAIPSSVTNIGDCAFMACSKLTTIINLYDGNQIIGRAALITGASNPKTAYADPKNENFINAATAAGYTIEYLASHDIFFTVTFNSNGGTEVPDAIGVPYNYIITEPTAPTKTDYTFGGWYKDTELKTPWNFETDAVTDNMELYAKWDDASITHPEPGSSSGGKSTRSKPAQGSAIVIFNGEEHNAGKEIKTTEDKKPTVIIELNNQVMENIIDETIRDNNTGAGSVIQIPITDTSSQVAKVELTGDIVKKLAESSVDTLIKWNNIEYIVPAEEFTSTNIAENLGVPEKDLQDIKFEVKISKIDETVVAHYNEVAKAHGAELIFPPVEFEIAAKTIKSDDTTREIKISKFSNYVERVMEIPAGIDPSKITTGIVFNSDGSYNHVPTQVYQKDGKWYAKLNSLTNSPYSVIWNQIMVSSVENHWSKETVNDMASRLVIFNPETFDPNKAITRADFAEYIVRALGLYREGYNYKNKFTDVSSTGERTLAILIAHEYGIVTGYPDGAFRPDREIIREEAMVMYQRAMEITKLSGSDQDRYLNYTDSAEVSSWAESYVKEVLSAQVFNGTTATTILPKSNLTYAEAAQAIKNLLVKSGLINQ